MGYATTIRNPRTHLGTLTSTSTTENMEKHKNRYPDVYFGGLGFLAQAAGNQMYTDTGLFRKPYLPADILNTLIWVLLPALLLLLGILLTMRRLKSRRIRPAHLEHRNRQQPKTRRTATKRETNQHIPHPQEPSTPGVNALEQKTLNLLSQAHHLREKNAIGEYHETIKHTIKQYICEKYRIDVHNLTTTQILSKLPDSAIDYVGEILYTCDIVHFNRYHPSDSELDDIYDTAWNFVTNPLEKPRDCQETKDKT